MNNPIKIAVYSGVSPSTTFIERLIGGLAKKGLKVFIFGQQNHKKTSSENIFYFTYKNKLSKSLFLIKYCFLLSLYKGKEKKRLDKIILSKKRNSKLLKVKYYPVLYHCPDIFHMQWAKSIEDWMWVQEFGMKLILSLRGTHVTISPIADERWKIKYSEYFHEIDGFHAVSKSMLSISELYGVEFSKMNIVKSGLDLRRLPFNSKTKKSGLVRIISIGRNHWVKGYTYALKCMKFLKEKGIDFHYTIVGVDTNEELLYQRSQFGLKNEVSFIDKMSFEEVLKKISMSNVLLLPSVEEGIANVVLEAMALGTLVVSTDCGGMDEVLTNNENGFIVPIRDAEAMAEALHTVSDLSLENYNKITKAARAFIEKQHSHKKMIQEMNELYKQVINK
ncbi:glycosyltransferase family 4 protein [uncultured Lutibacter sp.]|uniref:glycosyltransferase family 4 protein n=1 Tax=uncultured Lutibacter sp. TaxID=437739 RepID=UPI00261BCC1E|nr:glycosyltransferase family 4 protein [uncultured Lutibacter sp.]